MCLDNQGAIVYKCDLAEDGQTDSYILVMIRVPLNNQLICIFIQQLGVGAPAMKYNSLAKHISCT